MNQRGSSESGGIGFLGLLTIVFIVLKLIGKIDWAWYWVLSPLWITLVAAVFFVVIGLVVAFLCDKKKKPESRFRA